MGFRPTAMFATAGGGGGISGSVNLAWETSRFHLAAKFLTQNAGSQLYGAHKPLHTTTFVVVSAQFTTQNPGVTAKFTTANFTWHEIRPPPPRCITYANFILSMGETVLARIGGLGVWCGAVASHTDALVRWCTMIVCASCEYYWYACDP